MTNYASLLYRTGENMQNDDNQSMRNIEQSELATKAEELTETAQNQAVVITDDGAPLFYCVPAKEYEAMLQKIDDAELVQIVRDRKADTEISTSVDELRSKI